MERHSRHRGWVPIAAAVGLAGSVCLLPLARAEATTVDTDISWTDDLGKSGVRFSDWLGKPVVLTLAYTQCRRTCPNVTYRKLREIQKSLKSRGVPAQFVVITLDPEHDTPEVLARFRRRFEDADANWHFLTGKKTDLMRFAEKLEYQFWSMDEHIVHDFRIWLVDGNGRIRSTMDLRGASVEAFLNPIVPVKK